MSADTMEAQLAKDRVRHASRLEIDQARGDKQQVDAAIGMQGAIVYALLDLANAVRCPSADTKTERLLSITDSLVEAITDGANSDVIKRIADTFYIERQGYDVDQKSGNDIIPEMRK